MTGRNDKRGFAALRIHQLKGKTDHCCPLQRRWRNPELYRARFDVGTKHGTGS